MSVAALRRSVSAHADVWVIAAVVLLSLIRMAVLADGIIEQGTSGDIARYYQIATHGVPYRDQVVEYPPLAVLLFDTLHLIAPSRDAFGLAVIGMMAALDATLCIVMWRRFGWMVGVAFLTIDTLLYPVLLTRIDVVPTLLATLFVVLLRPRPVLSGLSWAAAIGMKLWPLSLIGFAACEQQPRQRRTLVVTMLIAAVALIASWLVLGGVSAISDVVTFRGASGWQIESLVGAALRAATGAPVVTEAGAQRVGVVPAGVGPALLVLGTVAGIVLSTVAARRGRWGSGWLASVLALLLPSTLLSTQFLIWALPGAALALFESRAAALAASVFGAGAALTTLEYNLYTPLAAGSAGVQLLLMVRNAVLVVAFCLAVRAVTTRNRSAAARIRP